MEFQQADIIFPLVRDHFSLDKESIDKFEKIIYNIEERKKYIPENILKFLDDDLRFSITMNKSILKEIDSGYKIFKTELLPFISDHKISYKNFSENIVEIGKQRFKLFKWIKKEIFNNEENLKRFAESFGLSLSLEIIDHDKVISFLEDKFNVIIESISSFKLPNTDIKLVFSYNFADYFLSATSENWSSCLNLESTYFGCSWSALPGLITDKNRALIYITNGESKKYKGITTEKFLTRTWCLLSEDDFFYPVRFYPSNYLRESYEKITKKFPFPVDFSRSFIDKNVSMSSTKYPIELLYHENGKSCYPYQDGTSFIKKADQKWFLCNSDEGGWIQINKHSESFTSGAFWRYENGLSGLIYMNKSLNYYLNSHECSECGCGLREDNCFHFSGDVFCCDCFHSLFFCCEECGETFPNNEEYYLDDVLLCGYCYSSLEERA